MIKVFYLYLVKPSLLDIEGRYVMYEINNTNYSNYSLVPTSRFTMDRKGITKRGDLDTLLEKPILRQVNRAMELFTKDHTGHVYFGREFRGDNRKIDIILNTEERDLGHSLIKRYYVC